MIDFTDWPQHLLATKYWHWLLSGWGITLLSSLLVVAASTLLGLLFAAARMAPAASVRWAAGLYLSAFRNTPLLVQLFFWYFAVPGLLPSGWTAWLNSPHSFAIGPLAVSWPSFEFVAALVGLVLYSTAYVGEEIRAGLGSVPRSQTQAAESLGMTPRQVLRHVVLPQALARIVSPLFGQYMNIVKNTSLGMTIGLVELSYRARQVEAETFQPFQVYGITTLLYVLLVIGLEMFSQHLQNRRQWGHTRMGRA
ncbi:putative glutamine ABC transporter permease protein GlnM [uncultured Comamonas sp.]|nr:putative glutamine ABC transporter permease protein GlnM [uncultured Comamonas sp.]